MDKQFELLEQLMADNETILSAIDSLKGEMRSQHANLHGMAATNSQKLDKLEIILTGGHEPQKGVIVRLDRVEQTEEGRRWWQRITMSGVILALIASVKAWFTSGAPTAGHGP